MIKDAWLPCVAGRNVMMFVDMQQAITKAKQARWQVSQLLLMHSEDWQLTAHTTNHDQLNIKFVINQELIKTWQIPLIQSGGVYNSAFLNLTCGKLLKQPDWWEWHNGNIFNWTNMNPSSCLETWQTTSCTPNFQKIQKNVIATKPHSIWTYSLGRRSISEKLVLFVALVVSRGSVFAM